MAAGHRNLARRVVELSGVGASDRALDIGCGPGNAAREAGRRGADVIGIDPAAACEHPRPRSAVTAFLK